MISTIKISILLIGTTRCRWKTFKGPQNLGGTNMYFFPNGAQVKGRFAPDGHYYDKDSGALVTMTLSMSTTGVSKSRRKSCESLCHHHS
ncbi:MAG: hypothetical protein ACLTZB_05690 [Streptococcus salivarius]